MSGRRAVAALALVTAGALGLGGCASGRLPETPGQRREAEIEELKARVVELARQAAVAESEIARLRQQVASLEARLGGRGAAATPPRSSAGTQPSTTASRETTAPARPAATPAPRPAPPATPSSAGRPALEESDLEADPLVAAPPAAPVPAPVPPRQPATPAARPVPAAELQPVPREAQAVYDDAYTLYHQGRFEEAERRFEEFLAVAPPTELSDNAQYWIGAARLSRGDHRGSLAAFRRTVELYPEGNKVPDALFKMGQALEELGDPGEARGVYEELSRRFPDTAAAALALERIAALPRGR
jgi:tol-pal system protein YbgF